MTGLLSIRTPDQRLRVFVSSTLQELAQERLVVERAIRRLRLTPVMFELGARPHPPRALYRAYLAQSQVFIGIYWQRYGWVAPSEEVSGLEDEYRLSEGLPRLIYVKEPAPEREPRLTDLLDRIRTEDTASYRAFRRHQQLARLAADDLALLVSERYREEVADEPHQEERHESVLTYRPIPPDPTPLVGRQQEVRAALRLLATPDVRLVTLTGPAGVGKTRLAMAVGRQAADVFPGGAVWVPVEHATDAGALYAEITKSLAVTQAGGVPTSETVTTELRGRKVLLVIDNFDQLLPVGAVLASLLEAAPDARAVVTSRAVLRLHVERELRLEPLPLRAGSRGGRSPAVQFMVAAGVRIRPSWNPRPAELTELASIAERLDGLPLAMELGAAWLRVLTPRQLNERLAESGLGLLVTGPSDLPERQRTLRGALDWSFRLLGEPEQRMLGRLSIFHGGATLQAIEDICNWKHDLDVITAVRILAEDSFLGTTTAGSPRVRMLEVIRQYATEQLFASGERDEVESHHTRYFADFCAAAYAGLDSPAQVAWLRRLDDEFDNIRAFSDRAISSGDVAVLTRLSTPIMMYLWLRGRHQEGLQLANGMLASPGTVDPAGQIWLRAWRLMFGFFATGDVRSLASEWPELLQRARAEDDGHLLGALLAAQATPALAGGDTTRAVASLKEAIVRLDAAGDRLLSDMVRTGLARLTLMLGDVSAAVEQLRTLSAETEQRGNAIADGTARALLGIALLEQGNTFEARRAFLSAASLYLQLGQARAQLSFILHGLAAALAAQGDAPLAAQAFGLSAAIRPAADGLWFERASLDRLLASNVTSGEEYRSQRIAGAQTTPEQVIARIENQGRIPGT